MFKFGKNNINYKHGKTTNITRCLDCNKKLRFWFSKRCNSCARKGNLNSQFGKNGIKSANYKDGRSLVKHFCIDCKTSICKQSNRCRSCSRKNLYKLGVIKIKNITRIKKIYKCLNCNIEIHRQNRRCKKCYIIYRIKKLPIIYCCMDCGIKISRHSATGGNGRCLKCSGIIRGGKNCKFYGKQMKHSKYIYYRTKWFHSSWEANFAKWCDGSNIKWEYESKTFDLGNTTYTPDFYLPEFDCYIEIKGYWRDDAKEKVNKFIELNPDINFKIFEKEDLLFYNIIKQ